MSNPEIDRTTPENFNMPSATDRLVNVDVPLDVAFDKMKMAKATEAVLTRLGCPGCHSGWDIRWRHIRDFTINPHTLEANPRTILGK